MLIASCDDLFRGMERGGDTRWEENGGFFNFKGGGDSVMSCALLSAC
jgi:hypothetical protein